ncbi:MAG: MATE family efflux transporter [Capnocytophaga sp.]|nr:MATE family efflux transporter [Capnocytophaga sp.]
MIFSQYTKEFKYNLRLATPIILSMLGHTLVGVIDNAMVGKLGTTELAAVSLGNSYIFLVLSFGIGFSTVITTLTAEAQKMDNFQWGKSILKHGIFINSLLSVFLMGLLFFSETIMRLTEQPENVIALAIPYINLVAISLIPVMFFQSFKQFYDGFSLTKYSLYVTIIGNLVNVILNYLFIYGNFGCPKLGVLGAGIGTLVSRFVMPILLWYFLYKDRRTSAYVVGFEWNKIHKETIKKLINLGIPSGLQMIFEAGVFIVAIWISGKLGTNYQASNQIALSLASMTFMISAGMSTVAMIRVGNYKGLQDYINLRRVAFSIFLFVVICQVFLALLIFSLKDILPILFLDKENVTTLENVTFVMQDASKLLLIAGIFQIADGLQVVALGALRGLQDVKIPMLFSFISYWLIAFPVSYVLGIYTDLATSGIWIGLLLGLTFAAIMLVSRFVFLSKKLIIIHHKNS